VGFNAKVEKFIIKSDIIHKNKYDYSKVFYKNGSKEKITIICDVHGEFKQLPSSHLRGQGCPKCKGWYRTNIGFIDKAIGIHGNKYTYEKVNYVNTTNKIIITCVKHGDFEQKPHHHIEGQGCPTCSGNKNGTDIFIGKSISVHGDKYDYSLVEYSHSRTKVIIICSIHGEFKQSPNIHLKGGGCQKCKSSKGEKLISDFLNENNIKFLPQHRFNDCRDKNTLPFDFYLPDHNICIEYDGELHYRARTYFGGVLGLIDRKNKDGIKNKFCKTKKIKLYRFNYKQCNKEIIDYLNKILIINNINDEY
jgi:hypothetical protein